MDERDILAEVPRDSTGDRAPLAADLGYADQSHLTREFTALFGEPPSWYAKRYPAG